MESEEQLRKILQDMQNETSTVRGDEFGLFDYHDFNFYYFRNIIRK